MEENNNPQQVPPPNPQYAQNTMINNEHQNGDDIKQMFLPTKNMQALVGYYLTIVAFIPIIGFLPAFGAVILGYLGFKKAKATPTPGAKAHALFALIGGGILLFLHIGLTTVLVLSA